MADEHKMGSMDISQHKQAWHGFVKATVWSTGATVVLLLLMAIFLV